MVFEVLVWATILALLSVGLLPWLQQRGRGTHPRRAVARRSARDAMPDAQNDRGRHERSPEDELLDALATHDTVHAAWTACVFDLHAVLDRPALADVRDPFTQRFLTAQEQAGALRPEPGTTPPPHLIRTYHGTVLELADAWDAADRHARELGVSDMTERERTSIRRAHLALNRVLDHRTPAAERMVAYRLVMELLDGIITLPDQGQERLLRMIGRHPGDDGTAHQLDPPA